MDKEPLIWAFDLGKGSIGEAVRRGTTFLHKASLLIPADFAETKTAASRRRMWRTRQAHKAREKWLDEVMRQAGVEVLRGRRIHRDSNTRKWLVVAGDFRLEQEFPAPGDSTCYTSCLLRIKLLRGERLESWQVYKAFHSAIQRRGYDPSIPWKGRGERKTSTADGDEAGTEARMEEFVKKLEAMAPKLPEYQFPCYYDAWRMGLWDPAHPEELKLRVNCRAESTRNEIVPRSLVEAEIRRLVEEAAKQYPQLSGQADYLLYGPAKTPYASYHPELRKKYGLREGGANDWQGVAGQKLPRFDNRIIGKCVLMPRMNVCKVRSDVKGEIHPQSRLAAEVAFLMRLKNMRIQRGGKPTALSAEEIRSIFEDPAFRNLAITEAAWKKKVCVPLLAHSLPGHESIKAPKTSGRSRFCRPALDIVKRLLLSGESPAEFHASELKRLKGNTNPLKGLVADDLKFLLQMGDSWEGIYIPNQRLDALIGQSANAEEAIRTLIGSQNDPVVRHRLGVFVGRLKELESDFGSPDAVVLEFVREDFMGKKAKLEYNKFQRDRAAERAKAKREAIEAGACEGGAWLKMELLKAQQGICLYTAEGLVPTKLDEYCIDHIVPRAKGGPDAVMNYVLTTRRANDDKGGQTPYEWLAATDGWDAFVNRVRERIGTLRNKKAQLLISPDAQTLVEKYTAIAETAWISKLAQTILDLRFGWRNGNDVAGHKRVMVVSGGLTGRVRRKYGFNRLLNPDAADEEEAEKKNRNDDRHHALDAMVISFIPTWARDLKKTGFFKFPDGVTRELFEREVKDVIPQNICFEKPSLAETIYGGRSDGNRTTIVQRVELASIAHKPIAPGKTKFDLGYARKQTGAIRDRSIQRRVSEFLESEPSERAWTDFCQSFRQMRKDGSLASSVRFVRMNVGTADEYKDLSKDGTGAYRKALKGHKGQLVYTEGPGKPRVCPVYAFDSIDSVRRKLTESACILGFFQSGCLVKITESVAHSKTPLKPGRYLLNTIRSDGFVVVTDSAGKVSQPIGLAKLIAAGLKRIE